MKGSSENAYCNPEHLLRMVRSGESEALDRLTRCYGARLMQAGLRYCRTSADAEDAVQETWLVAQEKLGEFRDEGSLEGWLVRIVAYSCRRMMRGRKNDPALHSSEEEPAGEDMSPLDSACYGEAGRILSAEMLSLSPSDRSILLLVESEGWKSVEVAAELGLTEGAVRTRLSRMKKRMKVALLNDYPEFSALDL